MSREVAALWVGARRPGRIVNIASLLALRTIRNVPSLCRGQGGARSSHPHAGAGAGAHGITVNAIAPGYFETDLNRAFLRSEAGRALVRAHSAGPQRRAARSRRRAAVAMLRRRRLYHRRRAAGRWRPRGERGVIEACSRERWRGSSAGPAERRGRSSTARWRHCAAARCGGIGGSTRRWAERPAARSCCATDGRRRSASVSISRDEFALLRGLHAGGASRCRQPLLYCGDPALTGAPFHLTAFARGQRRSGALVAAGPERRAGRAAWARACRAAAHPSAAGVSRRAGVAHRRRALADYRARLDAIGESAAGGGMGACAGSRATGREPLPPVLCHGDFRTGNYLVEEGRFVALLDWEFAGWGDPDEDLGWFCSRCWRFGARRARGGRHRPARRLRSRLMKRASGRRLDPARLRYLGGDGGAQMAGRSRCCSATVSPARANARSISL